ncbi:MAG: WYL domain-containing protein [Methylococcaceae bacterium]|nr:WYL domain-containing protein [Methylococcaceae bacterium]
MPRNSDLNAVSRQWEMLKLLPTKPPGITSLNLQRELHKLGYSVVKRTVERDLQDLSQPFPILCNDKGKPYGWYWNPGASANLPAITLAEALSLRLVEDLLKPLLPQAMLSSLQAHFNQAQVKLKSLRQDNVAGHWKDKVRHVPPALPLLPPNINAVVLDVVQTALLYDRQVEIQYEAANAEKSSIQTLHPLALVQRGSIAYLVATAFEYEDIRLYALHRIHKVMATDHPAARPANFNLDAYIASGALHFGDGTLRLKAYTSHELANYLRETALSKDQTLLEIDDCFHLTATVIDSWQLRWWILSQGDGIEVIEPIFLREEIAKCLKSAAGKYT